MLEPSNKAPASVIEGTVISVDLKRMACKVLSDRGHFFRNVSWFIPVADNGRSGDNYSPMPRDRVFLDVAQGVPCIVSGSGSSSLGREYTQYLASRKPISSTDFYDRYNLSTSSRFKSKGTSRAVDSIPGDRVLSSPGGSIVAALSSGSVLLKASPTSQFFLSKIDDLARIVSRNYEVFSDVAKRVDANVAGDVYNYEEYYSNLVNSRKEAPDYWEARGNTAAARSRLGDYVGKLDRIADDGVVKYQAVERQGGTKSRSWTHSLTKDGKSLRRSQDASNASFTEELVSDSQFKITVEDGSGGSVVFTLNADGNMKLDASTKVTIEAPKIDLGEESVLESSVLGDTLAEWFLSFAANYASHQHLGNLAVPTGTPMAAMDFTTVLATGGAYSKVNRNQ